MCPSAKDSDGKESTAVKKHATFRTRKSIMLMFGDKSAANVIFEQPDESSNSGAADTSSKHITTSFALSFLQ